jgi:signal transduction histidine kinase/FixJ family two-component response regulator
LTDEGDVQDVSSRSLSVLIVEDDKEDYFLISEALNSAGFSAHCERVDTEADYLAKLNDKLDIILADYSLPGFSAPRALELLAKSTLHIPFIVLTGFVSEETVVKCIKLGAADYLLKDRLVRLGPAVKRALEDSNRLRQRRTMEAALRQSNERFQALVEATRVIPFELNLDAWRVVYVGPQAVGLLGYQLEEWYRGWFWEFAVHPADRDLLERELREGDPPARDHEFTLRMLTKDSRTVYLDCVAAVNLESHRRSLRGFMTDVTELRKMQASLAQQAAIEEENRRIGEELKTKEIENLRAHEGREAAEVRAAMAEQLVQANEELLKASRKLRDTQAQLIQTEKMASLGQLVAGIAHEINNPMAFIVNNLFTAEKGLEKIAHEVEPSLSEASLVKFRKIRQRLAEMNEGLDRVKRMVLSLRTFSRLDEAGTKVVDVGSSIESVLLFLRHRTESRIKVKTVLDGEQALYCSGAQLNQLMMDLLTNAIEAIPGPGKITISAHPAGDVFLISVLDTGRGIPAAIRDRIFDPFFTTKQVGDGSGLGLATVYGIVHDHHGSIEIHSEEGAGTEVIVKIPRDLERRPDARGADILLADASGYERRL